MSGRKKKKVTTVCPYYVRVNNKAKDYKSIVCKACSFDIGFSNYIDKYWLSPRTYNTFYINTYCGGSVLHARDYYVKNKCKGKEFKKCKFFKNLKLNKQNPKSSN